MAKHIYIQGDVNTKRNLLLLFLSDYCPPLLYPLIKKENSNEKIGVGSTCPFILVYLATIELLLFLFLYSIICFQHGCLNKVAFVLWHATFLSH